MSFRLKVISIAVLFGCGVNAQGRHQCGLCLCVEWEYLLLLPQSTVNVHDIMRVLCVCVPYALSMNTPEVHTANHNKLQNAISFCIRCRARLFYAWTDQIFVVQFVNPRIVFHRIEWYREAAQIAAWLHCQSICRSRAEYEDMIRQISVSYSDKVRMHRRKL